MKRTFDTARRPSADAEFREYRPSPVAPPYRNHVPAPPRVESSPIAAICPQDLDQPPPDIERHEPPWRNRRATRR